MLMNRFKLPLRPPPPGIGDPAPPAGMDRVKLRAPSWRRYWPYGAGGVVVAAIAIYLLSGPGGSVYRVPVDRLTIGTVTHGAFEDYAAVRANVAPLVSDYLTTERGGMVKQVLVEDGAMVKAGQPLIELSNPQLALDVANREADTARQISGLQDTELQLERTRFQYEKDMLDNQYQLDLVTGVLARDKRLDDAHAIATMTYEQDKQKFAYYTKLRDATVSSHKNEQTIRERQLAQLRDILKELKSTLAAAHASLDALTIRAPMDGQLTALDALVGQSKAPGAVLGQIDSRDRFKLVAQVDEFYLGRVTVGQTAAFTIDGKSYRAHVAKLYPQVKDGTFKVDLTFLGTPPSGIHTGQAIDIKLQLGGAQVANILPNGPFYQDTGGNWAFVLTADGHSATRHPIHLGRRNPDYVEVLNGLSPGDKVIVSSYQGFDKVDRVKITAASGIN